MRTWALLALAAFASSAPGQSFEVASIKPSGPQSVRGSAGGPGHSDPTRFTSGRTSLLGLILKAYDVKPFQVSSSQPLEEAEFDVAAKVPPGATAEQFRAMLRNLLKDRFAFKAHIESREFPAYEMVVAKTGLKIQEARPDGRTPIQPNVIAENSFSEGYLLGKRPAETVLTNQAA